MVTPKRFLGSKCAASFLCIKVSTLYAWVHSGKIPYRKHGSKLVFCEAELREWSKGNSHPVKEAKSIDYLVRNGYIKSEIKESSSLTTEDTENSRASNF